MSDQVKFQFRREIDPNDPIYAAIQRFATTQQHQQQGHQHHHDVNADSVESSSLESSRSTNSIVTFHRDEVAELAALCEEMCCLLCSTSVDDCCKSAICCEIVCCAIQTKLEKKKQKGNKNIVHSGQEIQHIEMKKRKWDSGD